MATRQADYDDSPLTYDDITSTYDGTVVTPDPPTPTPVVPTGQSVSAHGMLTPQVIFEPHRQWSKEESERWINRLRKSPEELQVEAEREEAEAIAILLSLLL